LAHVFNLEEDIKWGHFGGYFETRLMGWAAYINSILYFRFRFEWAKVFVHV